MKNKRQLAIISIINKQPIKTHEQLVAELEKEGYTVTQATVSRDIRELSLIKKPDGVYAVVDRQGIFANSVRSVEFSCNIIVIKTDPGAAPAVAAFTDDAVGDEIMGSIAGDDTIFIVVKSVKSAEYLCEKIKVMLV